MTGSQLSAPARFEASAGTPLYVHLPYCETKCPYCDFFSLEAAGEDHAATVATMLREAERRAAALPSTVFLGGGTPSLLSEELLARLLDGLEGITGFRRSAAEVTAECNPESLTREKAACLLELGVTRLSIGFQSLDDEALRFLGRVHDADQCLRAWEAARAAGARRMSVDLIYGLPGQSAVSWERTLRRVLALGPEHLSAYNLTLEPGTPFGREAAAGRLRNLPDELELELFWLTRRVAAEHGLEAYEISNFARPGAACRHNLNYWENGTYVGIGPSAASKVGHRRSGNPRSLARWTEQVDAAESAPELGWSETLEPLHRLAETWWLGLRTTSGVDPARARRTAGFETAHDPAVALAEALGRERVLELDEGRWRLTDAGLPLADAVGARFLALGT